MEKHAEKLSQEQVWDKVARPWREYRGKPIPQVLDFLKGKSGKILDLGCGSGRHLIKLPSVEFYCADFSSQMLELAKEHAEKNNIPAKFFRTTLDNLPFEDNFFDCAIFIDSLHCIETGEAREQALKEMFRVLKPGKESLVSVWNKAQPRFEKKDKETFVGWKVEEESYKRYYYLYDKRELVDLLARSGFQVLEIIETQDNFLGIEKKVMVKVRKPITSLF